MSPELDTTARERLFVASLRSERALAISRDRPAEATKRQRDDDAGGGTRTPDTRIVIPLCFGSRKPLAEAGEQKRGQNRTLAAGA
jgi:hypothetical protein